MTRAFDAQARYDLDVPSFFPVITESEDAKPRDMQVRPVSAAFARGWIAKHHYTRTFPDSTRFVFGGFYGDALAGIVTYGMGVSLAQYRALLPDIKQGEYVELTRLWSPDGMPRNTESRLIALSLALLPPEIRLVLSFADPSRGHQGTIYQATNFVYCGQSAGGKMLVDGDGVEKHPRLLGIYRMRQPALANLSTPDLMRHLGFRYTESSAKHRYAKAVSTDTRQRKADHKALLARQLPYPKTERTPKEM
jgi:hypothetical protein